MSNEIDKWSRLELERTYEKIYPGLMTELDIFMGDLKQKIKTFPINLSFKARIKKFESFYQKSISRMKKGEEPFSSVSDLLAVRLICAFIEDITTVEDFLRKNFNVLSVDYKGDNLSFREFGYNSTHFDIRLKDSYPVEGWNGSLIVEVQVRTILQDAWAEVEHELVYKNKFTPQDYQLKHKLAAMNANLNLSDIIFQEIRSYQKQYRQQNELNNTLMQDQIERLFEKDFMPSEDNRVPSIVETPSHQTIDLVMLDALRDLNAAKFDSAITKLSKIMEGHLKPMVAQVILSHRATAYMACERYKEALEDFKTANKLHSNFKLCYYLGICYMVEKNYALAIDFFNKSLDMNYDQPQALLGRGRAYFKIGKYNNALSDCEECLKLSPNLRSAINFKELIKEHALKG